MNRQEFLRILAGGAFGALVPRCYAEAAEAPAADTFTYKVAAGCEIKADIYGAEPGAKKPAVMRIHGGVRWVARGNPEKPLHQQTVEIGIRDRLGRLPVVPETKLPGIIEDIQDVLPPGLAGKGPKRFGIDTDRIATSGESAGGYLTLMTGFCLDPRPRALVSYFGYGDIDGEWLSEPTSSIAGNR